MARITVEDCLSRENNRFALVLLAAKRTKQLLRGSKVTIEDQRDNKAVVTALREIADGLVRFKTEEDLEAERQRALKEREQQEAQELIFSTPSPVSSVADMPLPTVDGAQAETTAETPTETQAATPSEGAEGEGAEEESAGDSETPKSESEAATP